MEELDRKNSGYQGSGDASESRDHSAKFSIEGHECVIAPSDDDGAIFMLTSQADENEQYVPIGQFLLAGHRYIILTDRARCPGQNSDSEQFIADTLTRRELQIALMVAKGRVNKQIAYQLHLSEWTVSTHLRRIYAKLSVRSRAQMVAKLTLQGGFFS